MLLTKKILFKNTLPSLFAQPLHSGTRRHSVNLPMQHSTSRHKSHFFSQRVINLWNQISKETVSATLIKMFKSHLDKEWLCQEFLYNWEAAASSTRVWINNHNLHQTIFFVTGASQELQILNLR